jgi:hypothetical protein
MADTSQEGSYAPPTSQDSQTGVSKCQFLTLKVLTLPGFNRQTIKPNTLKAFIRGKYTNGNGSLTKLSATFVLRRRLMLMGIAQIMVANVTSCAN